MVTGQHPHGVPADKVIAADGAGRGRGASILLEPGDELSLFYKGAAVNASGSQALLRRNRQAGAEIVRR
jgi:hypothetical protein